MPGRTPEADPYDPPMSAPDHRRAALERLWPLFGLRVRTPRLELRYPDDGDLAELADLAALGVHDPATMPFTVPWTDKPSPALERGTLQHSWGLRANLAPDEWHLGLVTVVDGRVAGMQEVSGTQYPVLREVSTGSYLGRGFHRRGLGTEMRAAVLHLAFAGLGARHARSGAFDDNAASHGVSRALGYEPAGRRLVVRRGQASWMTDLRISRERWERARRDDIEIDGLAACLPLLGLAAEDATPVEPTSR